MQRKIIWESRHLVIDPLTERMMEPDEDTKSSYEEEHEDFYEHKPQIKRLGMMPFGAGGVVDLDDSLNPLRQFTFWLAHTNFNISKNVADSILKIPGVEIFRVLTRYRFIIAVGKVFNEADVKLQIQATLYGKDVVEIKSEVIKDTKIQNSVKCIANELEQLNAEWSILVFPNGSIDFCVNTDDFKDQYEATRVEYHECVKNAQCILIESS